MLAFKTTQMTYKKQTPPKVSDSGSRLCHQHPDTKCVVCEYVIHANDDMIVNGYDKPMHVECSDFVRTALFLLGDYGAWPKPSK